MYTTDRHLGKKGGEKATLLATMGARTPGTLTSGRLLKSEVISTKLGRIVCRFSSNCCLSSKQQVSNKYLSNLQDPHPCLNHSEF